MSKSPQKQPTTQSMAELLSRLFGEQTREASTTERSTQEWRTILKRIINELELYLQENIRTDEVHVGMLKAMLHFTKESTNDDDLWQAYSAGITKFALALMGDYPDHRRRKTGRKKDGHYKLDRARTVHYIQDDRQRLWTLILAGKYRYPQLSKDPEKVRAEFRRQFGYDKNLKEFFEWYRHNYPEDYAAIF